MSSGTLSFHRFWPTKMHPTDFLSQRVRGDGLAAKNPCADFNFTLMRVWCSGSGLYAYHTGDRWFDPTPKSVFLENVKNEQKQIKSADFLKISPIFKC